MRALEATLVVLMDPGAAVGGMSIVGGQLGADVDGGKGAYVRKLEGHELELSTSIVVELLCCGESEDCRHGWDCKNADFAWAWISW